MLRLLSPLGLAAGLLVFLGVFQSALIGQSLISGDIRGAVTDPQGATVPGAAVTAINTGTGANHQTETDAEGFYHFAFLRPGTYRVDINKSGFQPAHRNVQVLVSQTIAVDVQLEVSGVLERLEVVEGAALVQTENADLTAGVTLEQIQFLPNSGNDMTFLALVSPGTIIDTGGGFATFSANGLPATANLFTLNGQNDNDVYLNLSNSGPSNLMLGANELSEATVVRNGYSGQYGQLPGANVNYLTRTGSNEFHGNAAWLWNGRTMNANDFFNNASRTPRPFMNANQWYASIGGPIVKDKTFFFFDYEGLRNVLPTSVLVKIPSPQFETATIANLTATGQTQAVPFYQKAFGLWNAGPGATNAVPVPGGGCGTGPARFTLLGADVPCALQFRSTVGNFTKEDLWAARIDQEIRSTDKFYFRIWRDTGTQPTYTDPISPLFNVFSPQPGISGHISETHIFGARAVNQLVFSALHYNSLFGPRDENALLAAFPTTIQFVPRLFSNMGGEASTYPRGRNVTQYQLLDDFSRTYTGHTIKVGVNYRRYDISELGYGMLVHGRVFESNLADFYTGGGAGSRLSIRFPSATEQPLNIYQLGAYIQDDWRARRNLTVNVSLRLDHDSNPTCGRNCFSWLSSPFLQLNHDVSQPYNAAILANQHQAYADVTAVVWQPRLGLAWTPTGGGNTAIRSGVGVFEHSLPGNLAAGLSFQVPGVFSFANIPNGKITPGAPGNLFDIAAGAYQSLISGFNSGATLAAIKAVNPMFVPPSFTTTESTLRTPTYLEWNLEIQHALDGRNTVLSFNYVGNRGIHELFQNQGLNAFCGSAALCGGFGLPATAPDPRFGTVTVVTNAGTSNYNGLTLDLKHRLSGGLTFDVNYTWSHAIDMESNGGVQQYDVNSDRSIVLPENPYDMRRFNYGNADYDVRHYVGANYIWSDLFRHVFRSGPDAAFSGWILSGILFYRTGLPFTVFDTSITAPLAAGNFGGPIFAQQAASGPTTCGKSAIDNACFPATMFTDPKSFAAQTRNQFRGPGYFNTDVSVLKNFKLPRWEGAKIAVGMQAYNVLNHANFDKPVADFATGPGTFGMIQHTVSPPTTVYGQGVGAAVSGRVLQTKILLTF